MRVGIAVLAALVSTASAWAQAGVSHGGATGGLGAGHALGMERAGISGGARGPMMSGSGIAVRPVGPALRLSPSMSPQRFAAPKAFGTRSTVGSLDDRSGNWTSSGFIPSPNGQPQYSRDERHHVGYGVGYGYGFAYPAFEYSYLGSGLDGYDPNDPNTQARPQDAVQQEAAQPAQPYDQQYYPGGYGPEDAGPGWGDPGSGARAPYRGQTAVDTDPQTARSDGLIHPKVTLIFKDGRAPLQIQNYAMTQTKIFVRDQGRERDVPISDLDAAATAAANDQAGVEFSLPN